jgi:Zn-dependent protease
MLALLLPGFVVSFLGHEIAHKIVAQRNGMWAEFRTNIYGVMLTAMSAILPFKFLAPGQVTLQGNATKQSLGVIGLVGPGLNLVIGSISFLFARFTTGALSSALLTMTLFNAWLAIINLIPFGSFDGTNVFAWDKTRWGISFAGSCFLLLLSFYPRLL